MERWALPLSIAGILLVALTGVLTGKSFVHEYAAAGQPPGVVDSDVFGQITSAADLDLGRRVRGHDGVVVDSADRAGRRVDSRHQDAAVLHRLLGRPVLAVRPGGARDQDPARPDDRRGRRHRP